MKFNLEPEITPPATLASVVSYGALAVFTIWLALTGGCVSFTNASLATVASLSSGRADSVTLLMRADLIKQADTQAAARAATTLAEVGKIEREFMDYTAKRDKALLVLDKLGTALSLLKNAIMIGGKGKIDLAPAFAAFEDAKSLMAGLGLKLGGL